MPKSILQVIIFLYSLLPSYKTCYIVARHGHLSQIVAQAVKGLDTSSGDGTMLVPSHWASSGHKVGRDSANHTELSSHSMLLEFRNNFLKDKCKWPVG